MCSKKWSRNDLFSVQHLNIMTCITKFNFDLSLKNCAHDGHLLEGGLDRLRINGNPAEYADRPPCSRSEKPIS